MIRKSLSGVNDTRRIMLIVLKVALSLWFAGEGYRIIKTMIVYACVYVGGHNEPEIRPWRCF